MKKVLFILLFIILSFSLEAQTYFLQPFTTDYCTSYPEGTRERPELWKHCCLEHDLYFWAGGTKADREFTDLQLKRCVERTGARFQAKLMYWAVKLGGRSPIKFSSKKWGNGWGDEREADLKLSEDEIEVVIEEMSSSSEIDYQLKESFSQQLRSRR
jgi:hypothetical protein